VCDLSVVKEFPHLVQSGKCNETMRFKTPGPLFNGEHINRNKRIADPTINFQMTFAKSGHQ
jgi:hypothetical protein